MNVLGIKYGYNRRFRLVLYIGYLNLFRRIFLDYYEGVGICLVKFRISLTSVIVTKIDII